DGDYFAVVEAWNAGESRPYDIRVTPNPCGNGIVEIGERCDDGNLAPNDGCVSCSVEFGWQCLDSGPCVALPDVGAFGPGDMIMPQMGGPIAAGQNEEFVIAFTSDVVLSGTLDGFTTGDADFFVSDRFD